MCKHISEPLGKHYLLKWFLYLYFCTCVWFLYFIFQGLVTAACSLLEELSHTHGEFFQSCLSEAVQKLSGVSDFNYFNFFWQCQLLKITIYMCMNKALWSILLFMLTEWTMYIHMYMYKCFEKHTHTHTCTCTLF